MFWRDCDTIILDTTYTNIAEIRNKINQRRRQILVHSYIYYVCNDSLIDDWKWSKWAKELADLTKKYQYIADNDCVYSKEFEGFDPSTGFDFEYPEEIKRKAEWLMSLHEEGKMCQPDNCSDCLRK